VRALGKYGRPTCSINMADPRYRYVVRGEIAEHAVRWDNKLWG